MTMLLALSVTVAMSVLPVYAFNGTMTSYSSRQSVEIQKIEETAWEVQKAFNNKDLDALAKVCKFPLVNSFENGELIEIENRKALLDFGSSRIFTTKLSVFPLVISRTDRTLVEIKDAGTLMALGEDKFFTERLRDEIDRADVSKLEPVGKAGVHIGGDSGLTLYYLNGGWKINSVYQ